MILLVSEPSSLPEPQPARQPWPMGWIVAAVVGFIAVSTYVRLNYSREEAPVSPFAESQEAALGPLEGKDPWTRVPVEVVPANAQSGPSLLLNYLPMASGIPREFGALLPKDAVWPQLLEAAHLQRLPDGGLEITLAVLWPEGVSIPSGMLAFSRAAVTATDAPGGLLAQIRTDLERSIFLGDHLLLLPDPASPAARERSLSQSLQLRLPASALSAPHARIILPTRRGLAFIDPTAVP